MKPIIDLKKIDKNIKIACAENEITLGDLAKKCGMRETSLYKKRINGTWTLKDAVLVSRNLNKSVDQIFLN